MHATSNRPAKRRTSLGRKLLLAMGSALATLTLLEGGLRLFCPLPPAAADRVHRYLPSWTAIGPAPRTLRTDPGTLHGVTPGIVDNAFNRFGFLYPEERHQRREAAELRIAVVGGSTVECSMLAPSKRWPAVLETELQARLARPVTVLNLGLSAQDTRTHLATTSHIVTDLDVDACVFLVGTNDLGMVTSSNHPMLENDAFLPPPRWSRMVTNLLNDTQIARHLRVLREPRQGEGTTPYFAKAAAFQASLPPLAEDLRATATGLDHYARNVVTLAGICKEHGIAVLFTTQPCMFPPDPTPEQLRVYWGCHTGTHRISANNFVALLAVANERLRSTCAQHDYPCVDLASAVPKGLDWFYDQVHFNEAGARRVAEALVEPVCSLLR